MDSSYPIPSPSPIGEAYPLATPTAIGNNTEITAATATPSILYSDPSQVGMIDHGQVHYDFGGFGFVVFLVLAFIFLRAGNDVS